MKLNRIRAVLEDKGISQTWLAKKLGRSFSTVNAYAVSYTHLQNVILFLCRTMFWRIDNGRQSVS